MDALMNFGSGIFGGAWPAVWSLVKIVLIVAPLMLGVAYLTWAERKVIGYMQVRIGPNRVGPWGLIQPIADGLKLLLKEIIVPSGANKGVFIIAPMLAIAPALAAWAEWGGNPVLAAKAVRVASPNAGATEKRR